jgi:hypothetical protein
VIGTDCTCSCQPNYHMIMTTTAPLLLYITSVIHQVISYYYFSVSVTAGQFSFGQLSVVLCRYLNVQPISFWSVWTTWTSDNFVPFWQYYYRLTRTLTSLATQTDRSLADGWMAMLLDTLRNINAERDNIIHVWLRLLSGLLFIMNYSLFFKSKSTCTCLCKLDSRLSPICDLK